jgi:hypothetical protein
MLPSNGKAPRLPILEKSALASPPAAASRELRASIRMGTPLTGRSAEYLKMFSLERGSAKFGRSRLAKLSCNGRYTIKYNGLGVSGNLTRNTLSGFEITTPGGELTSSLQSNASRLVPPDSD